MNKHISLNKIPHIITLAAITGFLAIAPNTTHAQTTDSLLTDPVDQSEFPQITAQPVDQVVPIGGNVVLSVQANNADGYQWLCNGVLLDGQTTTRSLFKAPESAMWDYTHAKFSNGGEMVPTRTASVEVETTAGATVASTITARTLTAKATSASAMTASALTANTISGGMMAAGMPAGGPIVVFGTPLLGGGSQGSCPGHYAGYVYYSKPISQGGGWTPIAGNTVLTATDTNRTNTKIQYCGAYGDVGCAKTTVSIPYPRSARFMCLRSILPITSRLRRMAIPSY